MFGSAPDFSKLVRVIYLSGCRRGWTGQLKEKFMEERGFIRMSKGLDRSVKGEIHGGARRWEGERGARGGARGYLYIIIYIYMFIYLTGNISNIARGGRVPQ